MLPRYQSTRVVPKSGESYHPRDYILGGMLVFLGEGRNQRKKIFGKPHVSLAEA